jgi:DNA polymerase (family X)
MNNYEIADHFSLLSKLMDIHGENSFKAKSYASVAFNIERLPADVSAMTDAELFGVRGIGDNIGKKIRELQTTGKLYALEELLAQTPAGILDMLQIKGLGPKKIAVIWNELNIESLGELEYACNENRLVALKGFGAKTQENILQSIVYFKQNQGFHLWAEVEEMANALIGQLRQAHPVNRFSFAGDYRRQNEVIEYVEFVSDLNINELINDFNSITDTKTEIDGEVLMVSTVGRPKLKFYCVAKNEYYRKLFIYTGNRDFIEAFSKVYKMPDSPVSEEQIFADNGLAFIPPAQREGADIIAKAAGAHLPTVIVPGDIRGIIHSHSTWSDGVHTIEQMARAAIDKGLQYLVVSDHSQSAGYAGGLKPDRVAAQHQEIDALNAKLAPFRIFKSIESDILNDGSLDYSPQVLATFDMVIASVHSNLKMSEEKAMERVLAAIRNPYTTILGHPTGRLLLSRKGYPLDHEAIIDACAAYHVVIEINAHPRRLDIDWRWIPYAMERGVLLSIDPDAHAVDGYKDTYYGVMVAQKGGLTAARNLSSYTLAEFEAFLKGYKAKAAM